MIQKSFEQGIVGISLENLFCLCFEKYGRINREFRGPTSLLFNIKLEFTMPTGASINFSSKPNQRKKILYWWSYQVLVQCSVR